MPVAKYLDQGAWTAHVLNWVVDLQLVDGGWSVRVCHRPQRGDLLVVDRGDFFENAQKAAQWACDALKRKGVSVFLINGDRVTTLVDILRFTPAPTLVPDDVVVVVHESR